MSKMTTSRRERDGAETQVLYRTSDIQLSSFLALQGHTPLRIEGPRERRVFVFAQDERLTESISDYYRGTKPVPPQPLFRAYRALKHSL